MSKINDAKKILKQIGLPAEQQNEISAYTLLALCQIKPKDSWNKAIRKSQTITKGIMAFCKDVYNREYAPNTRETFRRQVLHQFVQARITDYNPDNPKLPVNSPKAHYALTNEALNVIRSFGTTQWEEEVRLFKINFGELSTKYNGKRKQNLIPVTLSNGKLLKLSPGKHNELQVAVIKDFAPRFAKDSKVIYLGDTAKKDLYIDRNTLRKLDTPITVHSKLPDIVLYDEKRGWIFLVEVVTSHGPVSPTRIIELEEMLKNCFTGKVYVTAFPDFSEFKKHSGNIAWETEVWVREAPDHMIHFNGDRFMGPR